MLNGSLDTPLFFGVKEDPVLREAAKAEAQVATAVGVAVTDLVQEGGLDEATIEEIEPGQKLVHLVHGRDRGSSGEQDVTAMVVQVVQVGFQLVIVHAGLPERLRQDALDAVEPEVAAFVVVHVNLPAELVQHFDFPSDFLPVVDVEGQVLPTQVINEAVGVMVEQAAAEEVGDQWHARGILARIRSIEFGN